MSDTRIDPEVPWTWAKTVTVLFVVAMICVPAVWALSYFSEKYHWSLNPDSETGSVEACYLSHGSTVPELIEKVKATIPDPATFEHVETFYTPSNITGRHSVLMRYRAKAANGEVHLDKAVGEMRDGDCKLLEWYIMDRK